MALIEAEKRDREERMAQERAVLQAEAETERKARSDEQAKVVEILGKALKRLSDGDLTKGIDTVFPQDYEKIRHDFNDAISSLSPDYSSRRVCVMAAVA